MRYFVLVTKYPFRIWKCKLSTRNELHGEKYLDGCFLTYYAVFVLF